ncbi:uncharacterized protein LOC144867627 [Branchiostoma floridae x Branchiostoma japonicum]
MAARLSRAAIICWLMFAAAPITDAQSSDSSDSSSLSDYSDGSSDLSSLWLERDPSWVMDSAGTPWVFNGVTYDAAKALDGDTGTYWNPQGTDRNYNNWYIVLDLTLSHTITRVAVNNYGDTTHDTAAFTLQKSQVGSPYNWEDVVTVTTVQGGTDQRQEFGGFQGTALYWRFLITKTHSGWQPWLTELDFYGAPVTDAQSSDSSSLSDSGDDSSSLSDSGDDSSSLSDSSDDSSSLSDSGDDSSSLSDSSDDSSSLSDSGDDSSSLSDSGDDSSSLSDSGDDSSSLSDYSDGSSDHSSPDEPTVIDSESIDSSYYNFYSNNYDYYNQPSAPDCGENLFAPSGGPVTSPNFPNNYGLYENCEWRITVPEGSIIRLTFDSFNTQYPYDILTIYDGADDSAPQLQRLTGLLPVSPITSTSNMMFLRFTSDRQHTDQGFQFSYISSTPGHCWDPGVPANGYRDNNSNFTSGQTIRYSCMAGYQVWGAANITCRTNGTWSDATPTCRTLRRVRLVGGSVPNEGRVEVQSEDGLNWGTVCGNGFDFRDADIVCRMLGYLRAIRINELAQEHQGKGPIFMDDLGCAGNESSLFNCSYPGWGIHGCRHYQDVGVVCDPSRIRLIGGSSENEGRVEVRPDNSFTWGTVCQDQFDMKDADVVCRMLGYPKADQVRTDANFSQGTGPIYMDDLQCAGNESSLFDCSYPGWTIHDCVHAQDVAVVCLTSAFK